MLKDMPIATLSNGVKVANFSSPHQFLFEDGTILPPCDEDRSQALSLKAIEKEVPGIKGTTDIDLNFKMTAAVLSAVIKAQHSEADIVLVPFPVMTSVKAEGLEIGKLRCIRTANRQTKEICISRFCR